MCMTSQDYPDLTGCDAEPIHVPGSIQPHGAMLIVDPASRVVVGQANAGAFIAGAILGRPLAALLSVGEDRLPATLPPEGLHVIGDVVVDGVTLDAVAFLSGRHLVVELTPKENGAVLDATFLVQLQHLGGAFERTTTLQDLCREAAAAFQKLTGYGRVMVYRFVDDEAGVVLGESLADGSSSFLNHHFPASDIPRQARVLYVRNRVRVIADVGYRPVPVTADDPALAGLDMSDSTLRSVSPIHIQYLRNMGVAASASMSIVMDGVLWGLVACHHHEPRTLSLTTRLACQTLATALARQIRAREESELYRERIRLRSQEDTVLARLGSDETLGDLFAQSGADLAALLQADGFAAIQGADLFVAGNCPDAIDVRAVAEFVRRPAAIKALATSQLAREMPAAAAYQELASGLLAVTMSTEVPTILMWFRAEHLQTVKWAGNPHEKVAHAPDQALAPRASFEAWSEGVRGRARDWSHAEVESAARIVRLMLEARNNRRMAQLNRELTTTLKENESLLLQKDFLLREVNHRVQNSLSLVAAFLRLQARTASDEVKAHLDEAERRLTAVSLVHRRLYQDDSVEIIDLARYLAELCAEFNTASDAGWREHLQLDLAPILVQTDRAVSLGLILNELITNVAKYAYDGAAGSLSIVLEQHRDMMRLIVSDRGAGPNQEIKGTGFGARMLTALVDRLGGHVDRSDNAPGLRVIVTAPIRAPGSAGPAEPV
jgi:light-regulated signal transduction histidine kinase (bacteriophytochrome)